MAHRLDGTIVPPHGPTPNRVLLVGEAPGRTEAEQLRPFAGKSGAEQRSYLARHSLTPDSFRLANVIPEYTSGNPDPTPDQIAAWTPVLEAEVEACTPKLIVAVGRFASQWFLGDEATMEVCHGIPHEGGAFDPSIAHRACGALVLPITHPAAGFYDQDARSAISWGYDRVAWALDLIRRNRRPDPLTDDYAGHEQYADVTGHDLAAILAPASHDGSPVALDTEGTPTAPWSIQITTTPGTGYCLRYSQPDFGVGAQSILDSALRGTTTIMHNALYDIEMCRAMYPTLDYRNPATTIADTMYAAYLLRLEPLGLKPLAWRWCGMRQPSYSDVVGDAGRMAQLYWLMEALELTASWERPPARTIRHNNGVEKLYRPAATNRRISRIIADIEAHKLDKDGNPPDPYKRWHNQTTDLKLWSQRHRELHVQVERELGPMPVGTLDDIPLTQAVNYACRDTDATLRLYYKLQNQLAANDSLPLFRRAMTVLPVFEEMQHSGMPASLPHFEALDEKLLAEMVEYQQRISRKYFSRRPFNPNSTKDVAALLRRRNLAPKKYTDNGAPSTSKSSIEHLRYTDPAINDVFEWREREHLRSSFCTPIIARLADLDYLGQLPSSLIAPVRCSFRPTGTATRRLATSNPNLLNIPSRTELGRMVRDCYRVEPGYLLGAWDLSQIEVRLAAHLAADPVLCRLINEGADIHTQTAAMVFGIPADEVAKDQRTVAKSITFGILYGMSDERLLNEIERQGVTGWTLDDCSAAIAKWLEVYAGIADYIARCVALVQRQGYITDPFNHRRYLPGIWAPDKKLRAEAGRIAVNHTIQAGAQSMLQNSMSYLRPIVWDMQQCGWDVLWTLQIHDELVFRFEAEAEEVLGEVVVEALTCHHGIPDMLVPVEANGAVAESWAGLK